MRDRRKDESYFHRYITYQKERIRNKSEKLLQSSENDDEKRKRINRSLLNYKIDLLIASYSVGEGRRVLESELESAVDTLVETDINNYEALLTLMSFITVYDKIELGRRVFQWNPSRLMEDKLLNLLLNYTLDETVCWEGRFTIDGIYDELNNLFDNDINQELVLSQYLSNWYRSRYDASWHDSHQSIHETYVGYWSFESAAIARILNLSEKKLRDNEFYPIM